MTQATIEVKEIFLFCGGTQLGFNKFIVFANR